MQKINNVKNRRRVWKIGRRGVGNIVNNLNSGIIEKTGNIRNL